MNYYTVLGSQDGLIVGTVFNSLTNQEVYKTKTYATQSQVTREVNIFLAQKSEHSTTTPQKTVTNVIKSTASLPSSPTKQQRCCGR
jgi:hypothetical protein